MNTYEFEVNGMSCAHCVAKVEKALKPLGKEVHVDLENRSATVLSDAGAEVLLAALDEVGYPGVLRD